MLEYCKQVCQMIDSVDWRSVFMVDTHTAIPRPFIWDYPGELVPEEIFFWTLWWTLDWKF